MKTVNKAFTFALILCIMILSVSITSFASDGDFNVAYNSENTNFVITGSTSTSSRVLLMVFSPVYNGSDAKEIYYFEAKNDVKGNYSFNVNMKSDATIGTYVFQVSVNGELSGQSEITYVWPDVHTELTLNKFDFASALTAGSSISLQADFVNKTQMSEQAPKAVIALYKKSDNSLIKCITSADMTIEKGQNASVVATITDLPQDIENYYVKGFLFSDFVKIDPITQCISLGK